MNVLVIGGSGLIGWHAVQELCQRGHQVKILSRRPPQGVALPNNVIFVKGDYLKDDISPAFEGVEGIIFVAGTDYRKLIRGSAWDFFYRTNVVATAHLFQKAEQAGIKRGVFVTSYYQVVDPGLIPDHPYVRSRAESEEAALNACSGELTLSMIQPSWAVGLGFAGHLSLPGTYVKWVHSRAPLFAPPGGTNFVAASSLGHAIATALEKGKHGDRYLIGDENITWAELLQRFARAAGRQTTVHTIPKGLVYASGTTIAWCLRLLGYESGLEPHKWSRSCVEELYFDPSPVQKILQYPRGNINQVIANIVNGESASPALDSLAV
jgi:dihydroflavonol-4-reductase